MPGNNAQAGWAAIHQVECLVMWGFFKRVAHIFKLADLARLYKYTIVLIKAGRKDFLEYI